MIGFPFDSLITYDEHGNPSYDRAVSSKPLKTLISKLFTTGVMPNPSDNGRNDGFCSSRICCN